MIANFANDDLAYARSQPWFHEDNGFHSLMAMERCHAPIVECVARLVAAADEAIPRPLRILDMGCGNGVLVARIAQTCEQVTPAGVDIEVAKIARARRLFPDFATAFRVGNLFDLPHLGLPESTNHVILLEVNCLLVRTRARTLLNSLRGRTRHIVVYSYQQRMPRGMPAVLTADVGLELDPAAGRVGPSATLIGVLHG